MNADPSSDPVFGALARALQPRPQLWPHLSWQRRPGDLPVMIIYRRDGLSESDRVHVMKQGGPGQIVAFDLLHDLFQAPVRWFDTEVEARPAFATFLAAWRASTSPVGSPRLMGVVNVTPDSFSDGGKFLDPERAIEHGLGLEAQGANVLDVGGESTRPGSEPAPVDEELRRTIPVIEALAKRVTIPISIDTTKSTVARAALDAGATIVNDVSAGRFDEGMLPLVAERGATFVAMHMQGTPQDMQADPRYGDVVAEVLEFLRERGAACLEAGIARDRIWVDPGIGFGKTLEHNLEILRRLHELRSLGLPILVGVSRKAFIARLHPPAKDDVTRLGGTAAAVALAVQGGAEILRVHDVAVMAEAAAVARAMMAPPGSASGSS